MSTLLEKAMEQVVALPQDEQDAIASQILASLADEDAWKKRFAEKREVIRRRALEALEEDGPDISAMSRDQIITRLRAHEQELKEAGITRLSLFGSIARGDGGPDSDIDIAVCVGEGFSSGGFDYFWALEQLQKRLSQLLGRKVDIVAEPVRKERFQNEIDRDRALAF